MKNKNTANNEIVQKFYIKLVRQNKIGSGIIFSSRFLYVSAPLSNIARKSAVYLTV